MESKPVQFSAIVDGIAKKKDGTLSIKLGTQELDSQDTAALFSFGNQQIWAAFAPVPLSEKEIELPDFIPEFEGQKSHSQRLHGVLYRVWEVLKEKGLTAKTSRQFYEEYIEKHMAQLKDKYLD